MPVNAERHAYRLVANLKQTGALRDYIWAYQKIMLDVPMMPEKDKLNWFIIGLQSWAQANMERSNPESLEQAYVAAERLADTQHRSYIDTFKSTKESDHDGKRDERRDNRSESSPHKATDRKPLFRKDNNGPPRKVTCWVCGGRHYTRVCPKWVRPTE
uniref:Retrotransposon gag domain-containing protein n=1 Tax=Nymphaea colorata TaxID=210225 RepID=A0A5K0Z6W4_9MAGN